MVRTQIQLTERQASALKKLSSVRRQSIAKLIRTGVDAILLSSAAIGPEERRRRALALAGKFKSGKRDVSKHHDKYLAGALRK